MPALEIHCGVLDVSLNAVLPIFEHNVRPVEAMITDASYDFISTLFIPTEVMQNLFHYRIAPQDVSGLFSDVPPVSYYTRSLEDDFDIAPVRFNPMCGEVSGSTTKFTNSCDNLDPLTTSAACDQDCNVVDYNIVPYVLMRYLALAVLNEADAWRVFTNSGDATWNTTTDIIPKLFNDAQLVCFGDSDGVVSNAFKAERALTTVASGKVVTNDNIFGSKTMADLIYRTMLAEDSTRFHVTDPTAAYNPMPFAHNDAVTFLFTIGMGAVTNIGDMAVDVVPNDLVIKVRLKCAGPGMNDPTSPAYDSDALFTSISQSLAPGVAENIKLAMAPNMSAEHTDFYINENLLPSIAGFDVPAPPDFDRGEC